MAATKAYVFVETAIGQLGAVLARVRQVPGVLRADSVSGPHDIILVMEADDLRTLGKTITEQVHVIPGVVRTMSCLVVE